MIFLLRKASSYFLACGNHSALAYYLSLGSTSGESISSAFQDAFQSIPQDRNPDIMQCISVTEKVNRMVLVHKVGYVDAPCASLLHHHFLCLFASHARQIKIWLNFGFRKCYDCLQNASLIVFLTGQLLVFHTLSVICCIPHFLYFTIKVHPVKCQHKMKDRSILGTLNQIVYTGICGQGVDSLWHVQYLDQDSYEWQLEHINIFSMIISIYGIT